MTERNVVSLAAYLQAERELMREDGRRGFMIDAVLYVIVNAVLVTVNLLVVPEFLWFIFPLVGWGIGLTFHYLFGVRWAAREAHSHEERVAVRVHENERRAA
jgi:uncharacterized membrane protein